MNMLNKKIVFLSYSGNVGKSTLAQNLIKYMQPYTPMLELTPIDKKTPNSFTEVGLSHRKRYGQVAIHTEMLCHDSIIVDISAGSMEKFIEYMRQFNWKNDKGDFDYFAIPALPNSPKIALDTIETIKILTQIGIPANKIKVILAVRSHDLQEVDDFVKSYQDIFNYHKSNNNFSLHSFNPDYAEDNFISIFCSD